MKKGNSKISAFFHPFPLPLHHQSKQNAMKRLDNSIEIMRIARKVLNLMVAVAGILILTACTDPYAKYTTWEERESVLLQVQDNEKTYNALMHRWLGEAGAHDYPFDSLQASLPVRKVTSPDGKLCIFSWDTYAEGIVRTYDNIIHYTDDGQTDVLHHNLWTLKDEKGDYAALATSDPGKDYGCLTMAIHQVTDNNGRTIYLTQNHLYDYMWSYTTIDAFTVVDGKLQALPGMFITANGEIRNEIEFSYEVDNWVASTEQFIGLTSVFGFDDTQKELYVPVAGEQNYISDRFERFVFNGNKFLCIDTVCNRSIHPSLQDFTELAQLYRIGKRFIRIDKMPDDTYRYASWTVGNATPEQVKMSRKPELVLTGGTIDDTREYYVFHDQDRTYRLNILQMGKQTLEISQGNAIISKEEQETAFM